MNAHRRIGRALASLVLSSGSLASSVCAQGNETSPVYFTTVAGSESSGSADGIGIAARFSFPAFVVVDAADNAYVTDAYNQTIRKITPDGIVTTLAGKVGEPGAVDGTTTDARFHGPVGLAFDRSGNLFVTEARGGTVRKISPAGIVTTVAGLLQWPWGVAVDREENLYVVELGNHTVRKITPAGIVTTLAGKIGSRGAKDGAGSEARFNQPSAVAIDGAGNLFVSDFGNSAIRKITPDGVVTTFAGLLDHSGSIDGTGSAARFGNPAGLTLDARGNLLVVDTGNATIRRISPAGAVTTIAGLPGSNGHADGAGEKARFNFPVGVATDAAGRVYVADSDNNCIRRSVLPPAATLQPANQNVQPGASVHLSADATSELPVRYQWHQGSRDIPGATASRLVLDRVEALDAGNYSVTVTSPAGSTTSEAATLTVQADRITSRLSNISVRSLLSAGQVVTVGIAVDGGMRDILVRALGPALIPLGVSQAIADPRLELFRGVTLELANDDWPVALAPTFASVGAFALSAGGKDAAFRRGLNGAYSIQARGNGPGVILVEAYAVGEDSAARLTNVSTRNRVGSGDSVVIAGFNISGPGATQLLIRAVGPGLAQSGVSDTLSDPKLELYDSSGTRLGGNDNWPMSLAPTFGLAGAFQLPTGSRDAALVTALPAGAYTVQVRGVDGDNGEALVEIYELR